MPDKTPQYATYFTTAVAGLGLGFGVGAGAVNVLQNIRIESLRGRIDAIELRLPVTPEVAAEVEEVE